MKLAIIHAHTIINLEKKRSRMTNEHFSRLQEGLNLYKKGLADKLVVTASHGINREHLGMNFHERSAIWLKRRGMPSKDVLHVPKARFTMEEVIGMREIIEEQQPEEVFIVTSDYHMPRAIALFKTAYPTKNFIEHPVNTGKPLEPESRIHRGARFVRRWRKSLERRGRL